MLYTFVAAIPQQKDTDENWKAWLQEQFEARDIFLGDDEELLYADEKRANNLLGFYGLIEPEQAHTLFQSQPWFELTKQECAWFKGLAGIFTWTHVADQDEAYNRLLPTLFGLYSTVIARTDTHKFRQPVGLFQFTLGNLLSKFGFSDGDAFLSRDDDYLLYIHTELMRCLEKAGLEGQIGYYESAHNPLRLYGELLRDGKPVSNKALELGRLTVDLWTTNWKVLEDNSKFWEE